MSRRGSDTVLAEGVLYKETNIGEFVLKRTIRLFPTKFSTYRDLASSDDNSTW